jgi:hypothetical protein
LHFDAAICIDNALPHLEAAPQLIPAAEQVRATLTPQACLIRASDYDGPLQERPAFQETSFCADEAQRRIVFQI